MASILGSLGAEIEVFDGGLLVNTDGLLSTEPCCDEIKKLRGGFFVIGPLLARFGEAVVALPGGCDIGARPIDLHIQGLRALGANVQLRSVFLLGLSLILEQNLFPILKFDTLITSKLDLLVWGGGGSS